MSHENDEVRKLTTERAFLARSVFPDASMAFAFERRDLSRCIDDCDVVLDTNVLLLPYRAARDSLDEIAKVLAPLRDQHRLFIPGQVAREFARNQPHKLGELYSALHLQASQAQAPNPQRYPLLESTPEYEALLKAAEELREAKARYTEATQAVTATIKAWGGNDPVLKVFRDLFTPNTVRDPPFDEEATLAEMERRYDLDIPPGYKDSRKPDGGIGDFLIWLTIEDIGRDRKRPLVFVTGEEKGDWHHRSSKTPFLPRYELVDEYRRASDGAQLFIVHLSDLLALLQAEVDTVAEVRQEEEREREPAVEYLACPECGADVICNIQAGVGSSALPTCDACGERFHAHRTSTGLITRKGPRRQQGRELVVTRCPQCDEEVLCELGLNPKDSAVPSCDGCGLHFHAHRRRDGSVISRMPGPGFGPNAE